MGVYVLINRCISEKKINKCIYDLIIAYKYEEFLHELLQIICDNRLSIFTNLLYG